MKLIFRKTHFNKMNLIFFQSDPKVLKKSDGFYISQNENYTKHILYNIKSSMYLSS